MDIMKQNVMDGADEIPSMNVLVVVAHPDRASLTWAVTEAFSKGAVEAGHKVDIADLVGEAFEPRELLADHDSFHGRGPVPDDVLQEQARVDRADALVLAFPLYWWSMPAVLKGWIDRVFINGWAYAYEDGKLAGTMRDIPVHLLAVGGVDSEGYAKHGYDVAFTTQIETGIFKYCGMTTIRKHFLLDSLSPDDAIRAGHLEKAFAIGRAVGAESFENA
ncbi:NAD(P)H-dependent oxidoreductase [Sphingopyxis sp.]|jgi:NAD(P)H dehydrogenase (quinone)|uniref:NAD(P)H-dependent oxidoreductase n=1 Tax=Sphingopyxis sp. TaxID=1908224 RepID=UPI002DE9B060|nr:NAD(P)H-dependent oxidoreductase [Sphingopyxis sp.]